MKTNRGTNKTNHGQSHVPTNRELSRIAWASESHRLCTHNKWWRKRRWSPHWRLTIPHGIWTHLWKICSTEIIPPLALGMSFLFSKCVMLFLMTAQFNDIQNWFRVDEVGQLLDDSPQIAPRPVDHIMSSLPFPRTVVQLDEELVLRVKFET